MYIDLPNPIPGTFVGGFGEVLRGVKFSRRFARDKQPQKVRVEE